MGLGDITPDWTYGEHGVLPKLLDDIIPDGYYWSKTAARGRKWVKMARAYILRTERTPRDRFIQAAHDIGEELGVDSETVKSALRRETFGDEAGIEVPREVLRRVDERVEECDDVTTEDILQVYRENAGNAQS